MAHIDSFEGLVAEDMLSDFKKIFEQSTALSSGYAVYLARTAYKKH